MPELDERFIVTQDELGIIFRLSGRDIRTLIGAGLPVMQRKGPKGGRRFYLRDAATWYLDHMRSRIDYEGEQLNLEQERARQASASADKTMLEVSRLKRELIPVAELEAPVRRWAVQTRDRLQGLPGRLKQRLPSLTSAELDLVREEVARCQNECVAVPESLEI